MEPKLKAHESLGPYRIVRFVGRGGMGEVYEAFEERLARKVALKLISPKNRDVDAVTISRFMQEGQSLAQVHHQNVVSVFAIDQINGHKFMAMEFIEGLPIDVIRKRFVLDARDAVFLMSQMLEGLKALHQKSIIHRDIKPGNIILQKNGATKYIDFGLARKVNESEFPHGANKVSQVYGTPRYLAPEVAAGAQATVASDIFSLGLVFYELFAGERLIDPRSELTARDILRSYSSFRFQPKQPVRRLMTNPIYKVLKKMLEPKPANRYKSAEQVLKDLKPLLRGGRKLGDLLFKKICLPIENYETVYKELIEKKKQTAFATKRVLTIALANPNYNETSDLSFKYTPQMIDSAERQFEKLFDVGLIAAAHEFERQSSGIKIKKSGLGFRFGWKSFVGVAVSIVVLILGRTELGDGTLASKVGRTISSISQGESLVGAPDRVFPVDELLWINQGSGLDRYKFTWLQELKTQDQAILEVASNKDFVKPKVRHAVNGFEALVSLRKPGRYYWRIQSQNHSMIGPFKFSVEDSLPPKLLSPANHHLIRTRFSRNGMPRPYTVNFFWRKKPFANSYVLEVSTEEGFAAPLVHRIVSNAQSAQEELAHGTYYWRMKVHSEGGGALEWSPTRTFTID